MFAWTTRSPSSLETVSKATRVLPLAESGSTNSSETVPSPEASAVKVVEAVATVSPSETVSPSTIRSLSSPSIVYSLPGIRPVYFTVSTTVPPTWVTFLSPSALSVASVWRSGLLVRGISARALATSIVELTAEIEVCAGAPVRLVFLSPAAGLPSG